MNITDSEILYLSGYSVLIGVMLAVCYGVFSFLRIIACPIDPASARGRAVTDIVTFIIDLLYSLFAGVCVALMFFGLNSGRVRLVGILGCAIGFSIYHFTLGRLVVRRFKCVVGAVRYGIHFVYLHTVGLMISLLIRWMKFMLRPLCRRFKGRNTTKKKNRKVKDEKLEFLG